LTRPPPPGHLLAPEPPLPPRIAVLLGLVEGLTEYLPVSSTGHLVFAGHLLGLPDDDPGTSSFEIVIQLGAVLAVVAHYRALLLDRARGLLAGKAEARQLLVAIVAAFLPTAAAGLLLRKTIKAHLFGPLPVAVALAVGGVVMIVVERVRAHRGKPGLVGLEHVTPRRAIAIGLGQCLSLWPGASRAMCTIVAGQLTGLSTATAAEFSFLLALPTLGAATIYEGLKARHALAEGVGLENLVIGLGVSFFVAWAVIATFLRYLQRRGLEPFGWYRVVLGAVVLWTLARP
jgi:undecaprenyl-diphosphatase